MNAGYLDNDGRFPDDSPVLTRYPVTAAQEVGHWDAWPWVPATILGQGAPDEWHLVVDGRYDLSRPDPDRPRGADPGEPQYRLYPCCFRGAGEIRAVSEAEWTRLCVRNDAP